MHSQSYRVNFAYASQRTHFGLSYLMEILLTLYQKEYFSAQEKLDARLYSFVHYFFG